MAASTVNSGFYLTTVAIFRNLGIGPNPWNRIGTAVTKKVDGSKQAVL
jgi:hypothetical protein